MDLFENYLAKYASTDNKSGTDKTTTHAYGPIYSKLFSELKTACQSCGGVKRVLELGVLSGASCLAFADYFENARIDGIDITLDNVKFGLDHKRIHLHCVNATSKETATSIWAADPANAMFDLVLDDASHLPDDQVASLEAYGGFIADHGLFVIEDIDGKHLETLRPRLEAAARAHGLDTIRWYDLRHVSGRYDDIVAIFSKSKVFDIEIKVNTKDRPKIL